MIMPVAAQTDVNAQIQALLAQIATLQAQLAGMQGGSSAAACTFSRSLTVGSTGDDVKCLQAALTASGHFTFAGGATGYFGSVTQAAVAAWQSANGVSPAAGYFGPLSQAKYNAMQAAAPAPVTPPATPSTFPAGCTSAVGFSPTTGLSCATVVTTTTTTNTGIEGSLSAKLAAFPADLTEVKEGESGVAVVAFEVKAKDNDVTLNRVDLNFNKRVWQSWTVLELYDGSTLLKSVVLNSASFDEVTAGTDYRLRLSGFSLPVAKDTTKTLTVKVSAPTLSESGAVNIAITANANSFSGTDAIGKTQNAPSAALAARTVKFLAKTTGNLEVIVSTNQPKERVVQVTDTGTTEVELFRFDVKATNNASKLKTLAVNIATTTQALDTIVDTAKLYVDGVTDALAAATPNAQSGTTTFTDLTDKISVDKDATKTLIVKAVVKKRTTNYVEDSTLVGTVNANGTDIVAEDVNFKTTTVTGSNVTGKKAHLFVKAPVFAFKSATITATEDSGFTTGLKSVANASMKFSVTAVGGTIYLKKFHATPASSGVAASTTAGGTASSTFSLATYSDGVTPAADTGGSATNWVIPSGSTRLFDVAQTTKNGSAAGFSNSYIVNLKWVTADDDLVAATTTTWGLEDFKTDSVNLEKHNSGA